MIIRELNKLCASILKYKNVNFRGIHVSYFFLNQEFGNLAITENTHVTETIINPEGFITNLRSSCSYARTTAYQLCCI